MIKSWKVLLFQRNVGRSEEGLRIPRDAYSHSILGVCSILMNDMFDELLSSQAASPVALRVKHYR